MKRACSLFFSTLALAVLFIGVLAPGPASAADGTLKWRYETGGIIFWSSPAIGPDGTIYVGSWDHYLYALNPNGTLKWRYETGNRVDSSPAIGPDATVYVGSWDHYLYALNPDGTLKWQFETGDEVWSSPAIGADGTIYVGSGDHYLYALNPNGTLKWQFETGDEIYSSPAVGADGTIYVGSWDHYLYALNADGTLKWQFLVYDGIYTSPALGPDGIIYVCDYLSYLYAIYPDSTQKWRFTVLGRIYNSPAIGPDGTIYVADDLGYLYAVNPDNTQKWRYQTGALIQSSPAIGRDGVIYVGSEDHYLYALNPNGTRRWWYLTEDRVDSSPAIGADGTIYVGSEDYYLYALNSSSLGPANSSWPMFHQDLKHTGQSLADLIEISVSNPPVDALAGSSFSITDTVKNQGSGAANGPSVTNYYLSASGTFDTSAKLVGTRTVLAVSAGATSTGTASISVPSTIPSGIYHIIACADATEVIAETNEDNNCTTASGSVAITNTLGAGVSPDQGTIGTEFMVTGSRLGATRGKVLIGSAAPRILTWSDSSIRCQLLKPPSAGTYDMTILPKGASPIVLPDGFAVKAPQIESLDPAGGAVGETITIQGLFFGTKKGKVTLGGKSCKALTWEMNPTTGESTIQFAVPKGLAPGTHELTVTTTGVGSDRTNFTLE